jgi:hypothetical protein
MTISALNPCSESILKDSGGLLVARLARRITRQGQSFSVLLQFGVRSFQVHVIIALS